MNTLDKEQLDSVKNTVAEVSEAFKDADISWDFSKDTCKIDIQLKPGADIAKAKSMMGNMNLIGEFIYSELNINLSDNQGKLLDQKSFVNIDDFDNEIDLEIELNKQG